MATMEELTKTQIVLLTLLISFITSIATGIITTALLAEAPAGVTQTINRVVEHTIEKVVSSPTTTPQVVREVTVVKEEDAILSSIDKTTQSVVTITFRGGDGTDDFYALGAIVTKEGYVISDGANLILDGSYTATLASGTRIPAVVVGRAADQGLAVFRLVSGDPKQTYSVMPLAQSDPRLGQSVIAIEGKTTHAVAVGRVTSLIMGADQKTVHAVDTDIPAKNETAGGPLIDLSGELVGLKSSSPAAELPPGTYTSLAAVKALLQNPSVR